MSMVISNDKVNVIGIEFRGRSVRLLGKRCSDADAAGDELSNQINETVAKLISELRLSCLLLSQVEVGQVVLAFLKLREHAEPALHRVQVTDIDKEKNNVIGALIDRCQWHVSISGNCLLVCPPLVQSIDPVCEVLVLADVCPPNNMPGQSPSTPMSPLGGGNQLSLTQQALFSLAAAGGVTTAQHLALHHNPHYGGMVMSPTSPMQQQFTFGALSPQQAILPLPPVVQLVSQLPPGFNLAWQASTASSVLVNYDPNGPWPESSVVAINDMLLGTRLGGRVLREPGHFPAFYPLDPAGSGLLVADVLVERGYSLRENHREKNNYPSKMMVSCPSPRMTAPQSPSFTFQRPNAIPASPNLLREGNNHRSLFFTRKPYPPNTREVCRITAIERGPWKFSIQLSSQAKEMKALRAQLNGFQPRNVYPVEGLQPGACAVCRHSADKMLLRAVITHPPRASMVMVFYVDVGESDQVSVSDVFLPTKEVADMPLLSIRSRLHGLPDTPDAKISNRFHHILANDTYTFVASVVKVADDLQMSFVTLEVCAQGATPFSMLDLIMLPEYTQCQLKDEDKVLVAYHDGVSDIVFFHLNVNLNLVDSIQDTVDAMVEGAACPLNRPPTPGLPCLAPHDGHYYRARVITPNTDDTVQVFYVDYGNVSNLSLSCLLSLPPSLLMPAAQACGAVVLLPEGQPALTLPELLQNIGDGPVSVVLSGATRLHRGERVPAVHLHCSDLLTSPPTTQQGEPAPPCHSGDSQSKQFQDGTVQSVESSSLPQEALLVQKVTATASPSIPDELARATKVLDAGSFAMCRVVHVHRNRFCVNLTQSDPQLQAIQRAVEEASMKNNGALPNFACWDIVGVHHSLVTAAGTGSWHRAEVLTLLDGGCCGLNLIDVGPSVKVPLMQMFPLPVTVASLPRLGVWCEANPAPPSEPGDPSPYASLLHRVVGVHFLHRLSHDDTWQVNLFNEFRSPPALTPPLPDELRNGSRGEPKRSTRNGSSEPRPCDASDNWRNKTAPTNGNHASPFTGDKLFSPVTPNGTSVSNAPIPSALKTRAPLATPSPPMAEAPAISGHYTSNGCPLPPTPMKVTDKRPLAVEAEVEAPRSPFKFQSRSLQHIEQLLTQNPLQTVGNRASPHPASVVGDSASPRTEPLSKGGNLKLISTDSKVTKRVSFSDPIQEETVFVSEELEPCRSTLGVEQDEQPPEPVGQVNDNKEQLPSQGLKYVMSSLDLSVEQEVNVQATWVTSPGEFWCHILGPENENFYKAQECFARMPRTEMIQVPAQAINVGDEVAALYSADKCWYRGKVLTIEPTMTREVFYCVQFIDFGNEDIVPATNIAVLTQDWRRLPVQGVHCRLPQLLPSGGTWSEEAVELAVSLLYDGELTLRLSRRLEDDTVMVTAVWGTKGELVDQLLTEELAEMEEDVVTVTTTPAPRMTPLPEAIGKEITYTPEPDTIHEDPQPKEEAIVCGIPKLPTARVSTVQSNTPAAAPAPPPSLKKSADGLEYSISSLDLSAEQDLKVQATWVTSPGEFWCHILGPENDTFHKVQEGFARTPVSEMTPAPTINVGDKVAAMYSADKSWYRAKVLSTESSMIREVFHCVQFLDFGNEDHVPTKSIALLPQDWRDMPIQGVHCRLPHLMPSGGTWSEEATELAVSLLYDGQLTVRFLRRLEDDSVMVTAVWGTKGELVDRLLTEEHADLEQESIVLNDGPAVVGTDATYEAKGNAVSILKADDILVDGFPTAPPLVSNERVYLCYCERGDPRDPCGPCVLLYLQRDADTDALCALEEDIAREAQHVLTWMPVGEDEPCLALSPKHGVWYRAVVLHQRNDGVAMVRYLDYGNTELIPDTDTGVAPCPFSLLQIPPLAHVCVLHRAPTSFDCNTFAKTWQDKVLSVRVHNDSEAAHPQVTLISGSRSVLSEFGVVDDLPPAAETVLAKDNTNRGNHRSKTTAHPVAASTSNQDCPTGGSKPEADAECLNGTHCSPRDQLSTASEYTADEQCATELTNVQPDYIVDEQYVPEDTDVASFAPHEQHATEHVVAVSDCASGQQYDVEEPVAASEYANDQQYVAKEVASAAESTTGDQHPTEDDVAAMEYSTDTQYVTEQVTTGQHLASAIEYASGDQYTTEEPTVHSEYATDQQYITDEVATVEFAAEEVTSDQYITEGAPADQQYITEAEPADQQYVTEAEPADQQYVTEAEPANQQYVTEAEPADQKYVTEAEPADQKYVTEAEPADQKYVTEAEPANQQYVTEAEPADQQYVTEAEPANQQYVTEAEPADQKYVTEAEPANQQYVTEAEPADQKYVTEAEPADQQYVTEAEPADQQYVTEAEPADQQYVTEAEPADQQYVTEAEPADQQYVTEAEPADQQYVTEAEPADQQYVTEAEPADQQYVTEAEPPDQQYVTEAEPADQQYVTEAEPADQQYVTEAEPADQQYVTETEPADQQYVTEAEPADQQYVTEAEPADQQYVTEAEPADQQYVTEAEPADQQYVTEDVPADQRYVTEAEPADQRYVTEAVPADQQYVTEAEPADQRYVTEDVPADQQYVTEDVPADQQYVTGDVPADQQYVSEAVPVDQHVTEAVPADQQYVTEAVLADQQYVTETEPADQQYVTEDVPADQQYVTEDVPADQQYVTEDVPADQQYVTEDVPADQQYVTEAVPADQQYVTEAVPADQQYVTEAVPADQQYVTEDVPADQQYVTEAIPADQQYVTEAVPAGAFYYTTDEPADTVEYATDQQYATEEIRIEEQYVTSTSKPAVMDNDAVDRPISEHSPINQELVAPECSPKGGSSTGSAQHEAAEKCAVENMTAEEVDKPCAAVVSQCTTADKSDAERTDCALSPVSFASVKRVTSDEEDEGTSEHKSADAERPSLILQKKTCSKPTLPIEDCTVNTDLTRVSGPLNEETKVKTYASCLTGSRNDEALKSLESSVPVIRERIDEMACNNEKQPGKSPNQVIEGKKETLLVTSVCSETPADNNRVNRSKSSTPEPSNCNQEIFDTERVAPTISCEGVTETLATCFGPTALSRELVEGKDEYVTRGNILTPPVVSATTDLAQHCEGKDETKITNEDAHLLKNCRDQECIETRLNDDVFTEPADDAQEVSKLPDHILASNAGTCVPNDALPADTKVSTTTVENEQRNGACIGDIVESLPDRILVEPSEVTQQDESARPVTTSDSTEYLKTDNIAGADKSDAPSVDRIFTTKSQNLESISENKLHSENLTETTVLSTRPEIQIPSERRADVNLVSAAPKNLRLPSRVSNPDETNLVPANAVVIKPFNSVLQFDAVAAPSTIATRVSETMATITAKCPPVQRTPCASDTAESQSRYVQSDRSTTDSSRSVSSNSKTWSFEHPLKLERRSKAFLPYIPKMGEIYPVTIIQVNPDLSMIVHLKDEMQEWTEMCSMLSSLVLQCNLERLSWPVVSDTFCCACYSGDGGWYRARHLADVSDTLSYVVFFDFGSYELVEKENIFKLPEQFWDVPSQALHVELRSSDTCADHEKSSVMTAIHGLNPDANVSAVFSKGRDGQFVVADLFVEGESLVPLMACPVCGNCAVYDEGNSDDKLEISDDDVFIIHLPPMDVPFGTLLAVDVKLVRGNKFAVTLDMFTCDVAKARDLLNFHMNVCKPSSCEAFPATGSYCVVQAFPEGSWCRAIMLDVTPAGSALVQCIDDCSIKTVSIEGLFALPAKFSLLPAQAVWCVFSNDQSLQRKHDLVRACETGELQLQFDSLDAEGRYEVSCAVVRGRSILEALDNTSVDTACNISELLPSHILTSTTVPGVRPAFDAQYLEDISTTDLRTAEELYSVPQAEVPSDRSVPIRVVEISDACTILIQTLETHAEFLDVISRLQNFMVTACVLPFSCIPPAGVFCVTKNTESEEWYRGLILGPSAGETVKVYGVDSGLVQVVPVLNAFPLPQPFSLLPALCIQANLLLVGCPNHVGCTALKNLCSLHGEDLIADFDCSPDGSLFVRKLVAPGKCVDLLDNCCEGINLSLGEAPGSLITLKDLCAEVVKAHHSTSGQSPSKCKKPTLRSTLNPITEEEEHHSVIKCPLLVSDEINNVQCPSAPPGEILPKDAKLDDLYVVNGSSGSRRGSGSYSPATKERNWWGSWNARNPPVTTEPCATRKLVVKVPSVISEVVKFGKVVHIDDSLSFSVWVLNIDDEDSLSFIENTLEKEVQMYSCVENIAFRSVYGAPLDGSFHRAVVLNVVIAGNCSNNSLSVLFIDRGQRCVVDRHQLRELPDYVTELPPLAEQVFLPVKVNDSSRAVKLLEDIALGQVCAYAKLPEGAKGGGEPDLVLATEESGDLAKCLVSKGYGEYRDPGYPDIAAELEGRVVMLLNARKTDEEEKTLFFTAADLEARLDVLKNKLPQ